MIRNFKDLEIWKVGQDIALDVYTLTKNYPKSEIFGMISQMRRSAISIPSNIAEGYNRLHKTEFKQFLFIALGSCAELETQAIISKKLGYIGEIEHDQLTNKISQESRMIRSLSNKLLINNNYQRPASNVQRPK